MRRWRAAATAVAPLLFLSVIACSDGEIGVSRILLPCDDPAPLEGLPGEFTPVVVSLEPGTDTEAEAARLAATCGFEVDKVGAVNHKFAAHMGMVSLGCVRCDPVVISVEVFVTFPEPFDPP